MARHVKTKSREPSYLFEFTRSELKLIADVVGDMSEGRCHLVYTEEHGDNVKPTKPSLKRLKSVAAALDGANAYDARDDYFDRWEKVVD